MSRSTLQQSHGFGFGNGNEAMSDYRLATHAQIRPTSACIGSGSGGFLCSASLAEPRKSTAQLGEHSNVGLHRSWYSSAAQTQVGGDFVNELDEAVPSGGGVLLDAISQQRLNKGDGLMSYSTRDTAVNQHLLQFNTLGRQMSLPNHWPVIHSFDAVGGNVQTRLAAGYMEQARFSSAKNDPASVGSYGSYGVISE